MSNNLMDKAIESKNELEAQLNKIIRDFELKTQSIILLEVKENKLILGVAVDIDKSTFKDNFLKELIRISAPDSKKDCEGERLINCIGRKVLSYVEKNR